MRGWVALMVAAAAPGVTDAQTRQLRLDLNIPALELVVYEGDRPIRAMPVAVGQVGHETPTGDFLVTHAEWNPWWRPPAREWAKDEKITPPGPENPMGKVKIFFSPLYYLHGTPEHESIGTPASHGCVRLRNADAVALARLLHERAGGSLPAATLQRILRRYRPTVVDRFRRPVPLRIRYDVAEVRDGELVLYPDLYRWGRLHAEAVYQALLAAGYDVRGLPRAAVQSVLDHAHAVWAANPLVAVRFPVAEAFGSLPRRALVTVDG